MEVIFEVRKTETGGYVARAPGHSIVAEADTWEALRENAVAAASLHFKDAPARPEFIRLHLVKDELIAARTGERVSESAPQAWLREPEPALATAPELEGVLAELSRREPIFHRPEFGTSRADFERMTAEDYWETGPPDAATPGSRCWTGWRSDSPSPTPTFGRRAASIAAD
jgi:hypothetical protein